MRKCWKWLIGLVALLLVGLLVWFLINFYYYSTKRLPPWEKEKVEREYYEVLWSGAKEYAHKHNPLIWYEDNDYVEEEHVWRYIGTYGDCHAFLVIGDNTDVFWNQLEPPFPIEGLSRVVEYPAANQVRIMLYHTKKAFTYDQFAQLDTGYDYLYKMRYLDEIRNREEWLTDAQFEQLTQDVEKLAEQQSKQ